MEGPRPAPGQGVLACGDPLDWETLLGDMESPSQTGQVPPQTQTMQCPVCCDHKCHLRVSWLCHASLLGTVQCPSMAITSHRTAAVPLTVLTQGMCAMKYSLVSPGSGLSPSWYLQHVIVRDLQSSKSYFFLVNDWLSVESEDNDGLVEREVFAASECSTSSGSFSALAPGPSFSPG